jgi:glucose/arabinose dehydrogenase
MRYLLLSVLAVPVIVILVLFNTYDLPILKVEDLVVEKFAACGVPHHLCSPTTMTFVEEDILILQKNNGVIHQVQDNFWGGKELAEKPVLEVAVNPIRESGLLGVTSVGSTVYIYFTEVDLDGEQLGNRIYKYDWDGDALINPVLLKELPSNEYHNGGAMVTGLDNQVYAVIGDTGKYGPLQNVLLEYLFPPDTPDYMDTSVILQVDPEGPYHAIGIRNSFGLAIDPITGNLWATENGDDSFDEINMIPEKFNSGWKVTMGPATESELSNLPNYEDYVYGDPQFSWEIPVAPTALAFAEFKEIDTYKNALFVGDCNNGNLYKFELNQERNGFEFDTPLLKDNVVNKNENIEEILIGTGFGCITDIESGPDGFLYVVSLGDGVIYRILPKAYLED